MIFTVVTKPTTRLEIVLGKVVGFAGVSAAILVIMGVFTFGYLEVRNRQLVGNIKTASWIPPRSRPIRRCGRRFGVLRLGGIAGDQEPGAARAMGLQVSHSRAPGQ